MKFQLKSKTIWRLPTSSPVCEINLGSLSMVYRQFCKKKQWHHKTFSILLEKLAQGNNQVWVQYAQGLFRKCDAYRKGWEYVQAIVCDMINFFPSWISSLPCTVISLLWFSQQNESFSTRLTSALPRNCSCQTTVVHNTPLWQVMLLAPFSAKCFECRYTDWQLHFITLLNALVCHWKLFGILWHVTRPCAALKKCWSLFLETLLDWVPWTFLFFLFT